MYYKAKIHNREMHSVFKKERTKQIKLVLIGTQEKANRQATIIRQVNETRQHCDLQKVH